MEIAFVLLLLAALSLGAASHAVRSRRQAFLSKVLKVDEPLLRQAARQVGADGAVVTGVTVFEVLYNTLNLEPHALRGIGNLHRAQNFTSLGDLVGFMRGEIITSEPGSREWRRMIHKYKGYTGEEVAFDNLEAEGDTIVTPGSATNPEWDVLVDGKPHNVKITDSPRYIRQHLERYPETDVITNREMEAAFGDHPRVVVDPELSAAKAFDVTESTFDGVQDLGESGDAVPVVALLMNSARNVRKVHRGDLNLRTAAEHTVVDTVAVGVGGKLGVKAGIAAGLALAPATGGLSAVVIPAATIVGSVAGVLAGKSIAGWVKNRHLRAALDRAKELATEFRAQFLQCYANVVAAADSFFNVRSAASEEGMKQEGLLKRMLFPSVMTLFYVEALRRLAEDREACRKYYEDLKAEVEQNEPSEGGVLLYEEGEAVLKGVEPLPSLHRAIGEQLKRIDAEKRKLA